MKDKAKKPRTDKRKNVGKVAEVLALDPNKTVREIAKETGLSVGAVHNSKGEVEQSGTKDKTITYITGASADRLIESSKIFDAKVKKIVKDKLIKTEDGYEIAEGKDLDHRDLVLLKDLAKDDMARITVLGGTLTDKQGRFDFSSMSDAELLELINKQ